MRADAVTSDASPANPGTNAASDARWQRPARSSRARAWPSGIQARSALETRLAGGASMTTRPPRIDLEQAVSDRSSWIVTLKIAGSVLLTNKNDKRMTANFPTMAADRALRRSPIRNLGFLGSRDFINVIDDRGADPRLARTASAKSKHQRFRPLRASV
jgi:hypothetical protein